MVAFTPLFLLITSPIMIGEFPNAGGFIGVILIIAGSYALNIKQRHISYFEPFKALLREKGPRYMLIVALIWSVTSNFDKIGVQNSSPIFWGLSVNILIALLLFPIILYRKSSLHQVKKLKILVPVGLFNALTFIFQLIAINLTLVAYVISIKRVSVIFSVLFGHFILKEKGIKERLIGVIMMVIGVLFITLS